MMFPSGSDTLRHFFVRTYLFKGDCVLRLRPDSSYHWKVSAMYLPPEKLDSVNRLIRMIDFKSIVLRGPRDNTAAYCLPKFGFVDSLENIELFIPFGKEKTMNSLLVMLDGNAVPTSDTAEIIDYTLNIKRKYLQFFPQPMLREVKFVPPIDK